MDEFNQISNSAILFQPSGLKFLKDCLEGVDKEESSQNLWVFATNHLKDIEEAVYREGRLSNPLNFSWNWNEFKKYCENYEIYNQLPERWRGTTFLNPEDNFWISKFNKSHFEKEFLGNDPDHPNRPKFRNLFITNNPDAVLEEENENDKVTDTEDQQIEIGEFLEFFWSLYESGDIMHYEGEFESFKKSTTEKVLAGLSIIISEKLSSLIDEMETGRIEGREEIMNSIRNIFEILGKRTQ